MQNIAAMFSSKKSTRHFEINVWVIVGTNYYPEVPYQANDPLPFLLVGYRGGLKDFEPQKFYYPQYLGVRCVIQKDPAIFKSSRAGNYPFYEGHFKFEIGQIKKVTESKPRPFKYVPAHHRTPVRQIFQPMKSLHYILTVIG